MIKQIICNLVGHIWEMPDDSYPTHGYREIPNRGAVCTRCMKVIE